ncbi:MAG: hypothetical protein II436_08190, partial [Oscillospiraceae bacterium]|nr:hypothetical protein [Oscillospiraceae bacterium]
REISCFKIPELYHKTAGKSRRDSTKYLARILQKLFQDFAKKQALFLQRLPENLFFPDKRILAFSRTHEQKFFGKNGKTPKKCSKKPK